ncbi:ribose-phosphate diphosphokinase [Parahaliea mediterranea]|uniref:Ribose-phosphate diphosphokinase n=2 Tax=Parahaliea mediterranea TaxID=651086 RepID=A0A939IML1_9GAMM|nr:ribose-phosphate diphosphokinase [Parahaliea mediterranea]
MSLQPRTTTPEEDGEEKGRAVVFALEPHPLQPSLATLLCADSGDFTTRQFPDGESYLRIATPVAGRPCIVVADLSHPNAKYLPLIFMLETLRELGASTVGLVAPYLSYMRQDRRFIQGEAVTSRIFAADISRHIDWLVTVDPHLHRYHSLDEIYRVPSHVVQGAPALADWLKNKQNLVLVGPDAESEQWVSGIAERSGHPFVIGSKVRRGDRDVQVTLPSMDAFRTHTAMIIDDVISSGQTILQCIRALRDQGVDRIACAAVHGIFADGVDEDLMAAGLESLVTTNTVVHQSNAVDISPLLVEPIVTCLLAEQHS